MTTSYPEDARDPWRNDGKPWSTPSEHEVRVRTVVGNPHARLAGTSAWPVDLILAGRSHP